jgi:hypothetical protein
MGVDVNLILLDEEEYKRLETKAARFYGESFYDHAASEKCFDFGRARDTLPNSETRVCDALIELSGKKAIEVLETLQQLHSCTCSLDSWETILDCIQKHLEVNVYAWVQ